MRNIQALTFGFFASTLLLASCQKEDNNGITPAPAGCKVTKAYVYDPSAGTIADSVFYTHTGNNVTKLQSTGDYVTLEYNSNNQVTKKNYYSSSATTPYEYLQISYNADNSISKIERFEKTATGYTSYERNDITYASGKINKILVYDITSTGSTLADEYTFTYTGENVTQVADKYTYSGQTSTDVYTYTYDTNPNYMKKQYSQIAFVDPFFGEFEPIFLPAVLSANNLVTLSAGGQSAPFSFATDSKQNVTAVNIAGQPLMKYSYQCQ